MCFCVGGILFFRDDFDILFCQFEKKGMVYMQGN